MSPGITDALLASSGAGVSACGEPDAAGDCEVGAVRAVRHWGNVPVLMDRSLNVEGDVVFRAGTHADAIRLNFRDWYEMVNLQVATFSDLPTAS